MTIVIDDTTAYDYFLSYLKDNRKLHREMWENEQSILLIFLHARRRRIINAREYEILKLRFKNKLTLEEVAKHYQVTRARIMQIEDKTLKKLKKIPGWEVRNA